LKQPARFSRLDSKTETAPLKWTDFESLMGQLTYAAQVGGEKPYYKLLLFAGITTYCGLRAGDVLTLRWVDIVGKTSINIREKKTGKVREIAFNTKLQGIIELAHQIASPERLDLFAVSSRDSAGKKPLSLQYLNRWLKTSFARFGIKAQNASSHTFRKTFGRRVFEMSHQSEEALITLSHIFNHSSVAITRSYIGLKRERITNIYMNL
jgi:integrase